MTTKYERVDDVTYRVIRDGKTVGFVQKWDGIYGCNWKAWRVEVEPNRDYAYFETRYQGAEWL